MVRRTIRKESRAVMEITSACRSLRSDIIRFRAYTVIMAEDRV